MTALQYHHEYYPNNYCYYKTNNWSRSIDATRSLKGKYASQDDVDLTNEIKELSAYVEPGTPEYKQVSNMNLSEQYGFDSPSYVGESPSYVVHRGHTLRCW